MTHTMTPEEFVQCFRREKDQQLTIYFDPSSGSLVAAQLAALACSPEQISAIRGILDTVLTDTLYTILLGLDGSASIGGVQQSYHICDENGSILTGDGMIEALAYDYFHGDRST